MWRSEHTVKTKTDGIFETWHWIVDSLCKHVWKWYHVRVILHVVLSSSRKYVSCPLSYHLLLVPSFDGWNDWFGIIEVGVRDPMSSANVCGFPCLSRHMNLKVSPLTKWNFAVYPGCVCVWYFCPCIFPWKSEHVWSIFIFGSGPLFGSPNKSMSTNCCLLGVGSTSGNSTISEVLPMNLVSIQREKSLFPQKTPKSLRRRVSWHFLSTNRRSFFGWKKGSRWV